MSMVTPGPGTLDLFRLRRERVQKLQTHMAQRNLDALVLLTSGGVLYATGAWTPLSDNGQSLQLRPVAVVLDGDPWPHLFTAYPFEAPPDLPDDHLHDALALERSEGVAELGRHLHDIAGAAPARIGFDDYTVAMWQELPAQLPAAEFKSAVGVLTAARLHKTADERECLRRSWSMCEAAHEAVEEALRPGLRTNEMTAIFLHRLFEVGATGNFLDPVFQAMPPRIDEGPWSTNGDVPFALVTNDHIVRHGDVIWTDCVTSYEGYASDVGRTWVVGPPSPPQRALFTRWKEVTDAVLDHVRPGVTGAELVDVATAANGGSKPWLDHYFLAHTLGLEGGEPQRIGSDLGREFDEQFVLEPGMALVIEPVTWEDGHMGYRCEELVLVTESGYEKVSQYPNRPFE